MKRATYIFTVIVGLMVAASNLSSCTVSKIAAQERVTQIAQKVDNQQYTVEANMVYPSRGSAINIMGSYTLKVSKDSVEAYLPFYGRAYTAPISSDESGIKFTSTNFKYSKRPIKKNGWEITIEPQDVRNSYQLYLTISSSGSCSLRVSSTNRESISFSGLLKE